MYITNSKCDGNLEVSLRRYDLSWGFGKHVELEIREDIQDGSIAQTKR